MVVVVVVEEEVLLVSVVVLVVVVVARVVVELVVVVVVFPEGVPPALVLVEEGVVALVVVVDGEVIVIVGIDEGSDTLETLVARFFGCAPKYPKAEMVAITKMIRTMEATAPEVVLFKRTILCRRKLPIPYATIC